LVGSQLAISQEGSSSKGPLCLQRKKQYPLFPRPNHRDTLACVYALMGDFNQAFKEEEAAVKDQPEKAFKERKERFRMKTGNCTGDK